MSGADSRSFPQPAAFELLTEGVQRQLYRMGWPSLRPIQAEAIRAYFKTDRHLLIMAETAGGKTEAAFLPVLSAISSEASGSIRAMYVGPLKALINDQFGRLEDLCTYLDVAVHRWHGDVAASSKAALLKKPGGVLLITPESLESLLINRTSSLQLLFGGMRAIVIDEVHAFLESERGLHLASLVSRLRRYVATGEPQPRMIGLSATVGDASIAQRYLSPDVPDEVMLITDDGGEKEIQFRIHGYLKPSDTAFPDGEDVDEEDDAKLRVMSSIAVDVVEHCRTHSNLVFANAKGDIELFANMANEICQHEGLPETFLVHHGSLAKDVREDAEVTMKSGRPMTTVCSSTLEMGIDIGSVRLVGQIGAPWSVTSFKQRLGRSGRKDGEPRRLRGYVICESASEDKDPLAQVPIDLLQTVAVCELMLRKWIEPPAPARLDLSTLSHQIISTIAELGAGDARELYDRLCIQGPFRGFSTPVFVRLLRELGAADVVEQGADGKLILGMVGERLRAQKDFYAAFASRTEYSIIAGDRTLGTLPIETMPKSGEHIVFAARRWQIVDIDAAKFAIHVQPARRRKRPRFTGGLGDVHPLIRDEMLAVLRSSVNPVYLDKVALEQLDAARLVARERDLARRRLVPISESRTLWLTWTGTASQRTLLAMLSLLGIDSSDREVAIECQLDSVSLGERLCANLDLLLDPARLASQIVPKQFRKYDHLFGESMLEEAIAADRVDLESAKAVCAVLAAVDG